MKNVLCTMLVASLLFITSCSNMTMLRTQELREVQNRVDTLSKEMMTLQNKLMDEQKTQSEILRLLRADQQVRFTDLDRKVTVIQGNLNDNQDKLLRIDEKTAEFQRRLEAQLASDSTAGNSRNVEMEKLFQIAMSDFNAGRYDIAINGFKDLDQQFEGSPTSIEAKYWVAECLYAKKEYVESEKAYFDYIKNYPDGGRACVSLYKLGLSYDKQNKAKSKEMVWKTLLERCPTSNEAQLIKAQQTAR